MSIVVGTGFVLSGVENVHCDYDDIVRRIGADPTWWDINGVPRYDTFRPEDSPNLYAEECVLLLVGCPECGGRFAVELNNGPFRGYYVLRVLIQEGEISYTSPPRHGCTGDAAQSVAIRVLQYWHRGPELAWERVVSLEVSVLAEGAVEDEGEGKRA